MQTTTTITPKFQIHLPLSIRRAAGFDQHGRALIRAQKNRIIIEPLPISFLSLGGKFEVKKSVPAETIRDHINYSRVG